MDDSESVFHVSSSNRYFCESITISLATQKLPGSALDKKVALIQYMLFAL